MIPQLNNKFSFLFYYQSILAISAIFTFFTGLDLYLFETGVIPLSPRLIITLFGIASLPIIISSFSKTNPISVPLILWCAGYVVILLISFFLFPANEIQFRELRIRLVGVIFTIIMAVIFSGHYIIQLWTRRAIFIAVLIAIFNIVYQMFAPTAFKVENITTGLRPAGFYVDANKAACALLIGMIFCIGLLKPKYRIYFILLIGLMILLTFSRGGILCWFVTVGIMLNKRLIPRRHLLYSFVGLGVITIFLTLVQGNLIDNLIQLDTNDRNYRMMFERLAWFEDTSSLSDDSSEARFAVAVIGWTLFTESPFIGNGIGSTAELSIGINTHNTYLALMADHGILGALILPLLAYTMTRNARGESKYIALSCTALFLLWSLFSHTVLEDRFILVMVSLMTAMTTTSQVDRRYQIGHTL